MVDDKPMDYTIIIILNHRSKYRNGVMIKEITNGTGCLYYGWHFYCIRFCYNRPDDNTSVTNLISSIISQQIQLEREKWMEMIGDWLGTANIKPYSQNKPNEINKQLRTETNQNLKWNISPLMHFVAGGGHLKSKHFVFIRSIHFWFLRGITSKQNALPFSLAFPIIFIQ